MIYEKEESLSLDEGYGIQLSTNSTKILNQIGFQKLVMKKYITLKELIFIIFKIKKYVN